MAPVLKEPIAVQPFLDWCDARMDRIERDLNEKPAIKGGEQFSILGRLLDEIGWEHETGGRRLHRWRFTNLEAMVERAVVEDALHRAGVAMWDVYPDLDYPVGDGVDRSVMNRYMTDQQVVAAHTLYIKLDMTMATVAELIWERYGYTNARSAARALTPAFKRLGLPTRRCTEIAASGRPCERHPVNGLKLCAEHSGGQRPTDIARAVYVANAMGSGWKIPEEMLDRAREMHANGVGLYMVSDVLIVETPWKHPAYLARQLAREFDARGWPRLRRGFNQRVGEELAA